MEIMERRNFLKLTLGLAAVAAGTAAVTPSKALPVMAPVEPQQPKTEAKPEPAVAAPNDIDAAKPENVRWYWRRWHWRRWRWCRRHRC
jgi:hypothetical protein